MNDTNRVFKCGKEIKYGISRTQTELMQQEVGVEVTSSSGIELVEFGTKLNCQFTYSSSSSYTKFTEQMVKETINVPAKNATALFSKHIRIKGRRWMMRRRSVELSLSQMANCILADASLTRHPYFSSHDAIGMDQGNIDFFGGKGKGAILSLFPQDCLFLY